MVHIVLQLPEMYAAAQQVQRMAHHLVHPFAAAIAALGTICLLYTSDAADERSSVDLGGRGIIKKKKQVKNKKKYNYNDITDSMHKKTTSSI